MTRPPRRWYRGSVATKISIDARTCPRCGRKGALGLRVVDDRSYWFCKWAKLNKCAKGPVPTKPEY